MGEALNDLEQLLISKRAKLTPDEGNILLSCKTKAITNFTVFSLVSGAAAWKATGRLGKAFQVNLTAGAAAFCGLSIFSRSLYSSADHILSLDGSILQKELANMFVFSSQLHSLDEHFWFVQ